MTKWAPAYFILDSAEASKLACSLGLRASNSASDKPTKLPVWVTAEESYIIEANVDRYRDYFHGVNSKLMKCGGLTPARRMIDRARESELQVMVGCMTESTVSISAIAQLLPLLDYVDIDGVLLLAQDIASGVTVDQG